MSAHLARFIAITELLQSTGVFWQASAFYCHALAWQRDHPALSEAILALGTAEFESLAQTPEALQQFLVAHIPQLGELAELTRLRAVHVPATLNERLATDVPGRKWQQIRAFVGAVDLAGATAPANRAVLDWCSGKAYLGRALAHHWGCSLHAVDNQAALCAAGSAQAARWAPVRYSCKNVLQEPHLFEDSDYVIALHACGDLHRSLLRQWRQSVSPALALVPCCYQHWLTDRYPPLSQAAQAHNLLLTKNQVHLAVQEMVTASAASRNQVHLLGQWRMAFDLIRQTLEGSDSAITTPSLPYSWVARGPEAVIRYLAERRGLVIPEGFSLAPHLEAAQRRYQQYLRLQLVNQGFRRALELWLVLDLALFLEEGRLTVDLVTFCPRSVTPRNIMVLARR